MGLENINSLFEDVKNKKFNKGNKRYTDIFLKDNRVKELRCFLDEEYVKKGTGIKCLIKDYKLNITYSSLRKILIFLNYELHSNTIANDALKKRRSDNAKLQYKTKTGFFKEGVQENIHNSKSIHRGIQGYYWNKSKSKYVWLRSSWEYIYAKWLNEHNIIWDVEVKTYNLNNTTYRPDFFIFDNKDNIISIVEVKGFWRNREYKVDLLKKELQINISIIHDISPYSKNINYDVKQWKILRKLELEK